MQFSKQEYWSGLPLFSRESSWPKDQTCVSCLAGRFFTTEPPWKAHWAELHDIYNYLCLLVQVPTLLLFLVSCLSMYTHFVLETTTITSLFSSMYLSKSINVFQLIPSKVGRPLLFLATVPVGVSVCCFTCSGTFLTLQNYFSVFSYLMFL